MATLEEGMYSYITGLAAISALIGSGDDARMYPNELPQNPTYPAIVYHLISTNDLMAHDGATDFMKKRLQFDCFGETYGSAKNLAKILRQQINGQSGALGGITVHGIFFKNEQDDFGPNVEVDLTQVDFLITYKDE